MTVQIQTDKKLAGYTGLAFPFRFGPLGKLETSTTGPYEITHIIDSIQQIVSTLAGTRNKAGERYIIRDFGGHIPALVFEPLNAAGLLRIKALMIRALSKWEPRVRVNRVDITNIVEDEGRIHVEMDILVIKTQQLLEIEFTV